MTPEVVSSALENWTLHTLAVATMLVGFVAFALVLAGAGYREMVRSRLTLRLTNETLHAIWDVVTDVLLFESVLAGFVLLSRDIMSEISLPVPLLPLATLALLVGLGLRAFVRRADPRRAPVVGRRGSHRNRLRPQLARPLLRDERAGRRNGCLGILRPPGASGPACARMRTPRWPRRPSSGCSRSCWPLACGWCSRRCGEWVGEPKRPPRW